MATTISFPTAVIDPDSTNAHNCFADDGVNTLALPQIGNDITWSTFTGLSIPAGATIDGIEIICEATSNSYNQSPDFAVYNGAWSSFQNCVDHWENKSWATKDPGWGANNDLWGLTWTPTSAANIAIKVDLSVMTSGRIMYMDFLQVRVTYTPGIISNGKITLSSGLIQLTSGKISL